LQGIQQNSELTIFLFWVEFLGPLPDDLLPLPDDLKGVMLPGDNDLGNSFFAVLIFM
jgi:hypothetical protein